MPLELLHELRDVRPVSLRCRLTRGHSATGSRRLAGDGLHLLERARAASAAHRAKESDVGQTPSISGQVRSDWRRNRPSPNRRPDDCPSSDNLRQMAA